MAEYAQLLDPMTNTTSDKVILRRVDQAYIPFDGGNRDYQAYLEWLAAGNTPDPVEKNVSI